MASYTAAVQSNFASDADFRAYVTGIHNAIVGAGLTQTADTGQIDATTVTKPAGAQLSAGYEIFRFNDSLQATAPVYIKVEYGTGGSAAAPAIWVTVGTGTDGAGTITGTVVAARRMAAWSGGVGGTTTVWASSDGAALSLAFTTTASGNNTIVIALERTRDADGTPNSIGVATLVWSTFNGAVFNTGVFGAGVPAGVNIFPVVAPGNGSVSLVGTDVGVCTPIHFAGKPYYGLSYCVYNSPNIGAGASFSTTVLGATHTYMPLNVGPTATQTVAIRFE